GQQHADRLVPVAHQPPAVGVEEPLGTVPLEDLVDGADAGQLGAVERPLVSALVGGAKLLGAGGGGGLEGQPWQGGGGGGRAGEAGRAAGEGSGWRRYQRFVTWGRPLRTREAARASSSGARRAWKTLTPLRSRAARP